jgi:hypothetical protein
VSGLVSITSLSQNSDTGYLENKERFILTYDPGGSGSKSNSSLVWATSEAACHCGSSCQSKCSHHESGSREDEQGPMIPS